jgi:uncharacterized surface protein with fasciclin (FAS1) repeats
MQTHFIPNKTFSAFFLYFKLLIMKKFCVFTCIAAILIIATNICLSQAIKPSTSEGTAIVDENQITKANTQQDGTIADLINVSKELSTLLVALKSAGTLETLKSAGPFTVFAPTNDAFSKVPPAALDDLLKTENKNTLSKVLGNHVIAGNIKSEDIIASIKEGKGVATFSTLSGDKLTASLDGERLKLTDSNGNSSYVNTTSLIASNGIIHPIDTVLSGK